MENKLQPSRVLISILSAVGVWTFKSDWQSLYRLYGFTLHLIFSYAFTLAMYINIAFITSLEDTTEALYMCLTETAMLVKISTMFINGSRISSLVAFMLDKKLTLKNQAEVDVFISNYTFFNRTRISYLTVCLLCITSGFVGPLFLEETKFPFPAWFPFDWRNSSSTYWILYGYEVVAMTINCVTNATLDLFQAYLLFQLSMYFELIGLRLQNVGRKSTPLEGAPKVVEGSSVQELIEHVKLHQNILSNKTNAIFYQVLYTYLPISLNEIVNIHYAFCNIIQNRKISRYRMATEVQEIISIPIFVQFNLSAVVICFTAFQLKTISPIEDTGTFLLHFYYIVAMVFQIFLSCFYGDLVTSRSYALTNAIYNSNWVELDIKYQKLIFIYMESMKKPIKIQAGSLFVIGLSIFTTIINNAYSLFALLLNMDK